MAGREILQYAPPRPPVGIHRYIFVLFQQKNLPSYELMQKEAPAARNNFKTRDFAEQYGLGLPVATVYFNAQKEPMNKRR
ncbi:hypothetical protein ACLOJK_032395 [Asimina triloba]